MLLAQLTARLGSLGDAEYAGDLCFASEVVERRRRLGGTLLCHHHRRRGHYSRLDAQPVPSVEAQRSRGHVGSFLFARDLTDGE